MTTIEPTTGPEQKSLKPTGVLKVVTIPPRFFSDSYPATVKPGNTVWGSSWYRGSRRGVSFQDQLDAMARRDEGRLFFTPEVRSGTGVPGAKSSKETQKPTMSLQDQFFNNSTGMVIGVVILCVVIWAVKRYRPGLPPPSPGV